MDEADPHAVRAAAGGDLEAFETIVRAYQTPVWRFLRDLVGDEQLAEDLAQETFIRVFRRLDSFRFESKFSTWLFRIARNIAVDALRSRGRRNLMVSRLSPAEHEGGPELHTEMAAAVATLSPKLREALLLVEVVGMTCAQAGEVLGVPVGTVKSRLYLARRELIGWFTAGEEVAGDL